MQLSLTGIFSHGLLFYLFLTKEGKLSMAKKVVFSDQSIIQNRERGIVNRAKIMHFISRIVKVNLLKTFLIMFRFSRNKISSFIIGWNTIVRVKKTAVISVCPEGRLTIGMNEVNGNKTFV